MAADLGGLALQDVEVERQLRSRAAILEAVRLAAERFLDPATSWREHLPEVLATLARATGTSRVYLFENRREEAGEVWAEQTFEWSAPGVRSIADVPLLADMPMRATGFGRWMEEFHRGETVHGLRRQLPPRERVQLEADETLSIAVVPVTVEGRWWGMLGFDECAFERIWTAAEIDGLRAAASTIAAAIEADRAGAELRRREAEYREVFEAIGDGLVVATPAGRIVTANPAFCRMLGTDPASVVGTELTRWVAPERHHLVDDLEAAVASGAVHAVDNVHVHTDGTRFPVEVRASAFTFRGQPHVLAVVRDVTERHALRTLLERRLRALSEVAAAITLDQPLEATLSHVARTLVEAGSASACSVQLLAEDGSPGLVASHGLPQGDEEGLRLVLPLDSLGRHAGAVSVHLPDKDPPSDDERAFLGAIVDQAATAVENDRLLQGARETAALTERQRLARELHDSVSQALFGIALGARTARALAETDPQAAAEPLEYVLTLAEAGLAEMRALIFELLPEAIETEGLVTALDRQMRAVRARHQLRIDVTLGVEPDVPLAFKEALYRIAQEAVHNVVKHAAASRVEVALATAGDVLSLRVTDDGRGFDTSGSFTGHLGLHSMRERAELLGGSCGLRSRPGEGTSIEVRLPLSPGAAA